MTTTVANNNSELYLELSDTLIEDTMVARCNPLEVVREGSCRYLFKFSGFYIETPETDMYGNPFWANDIAVLKADDGTYLRMEFGERHPSTWSNGRMVLPDRHTIKRVIVNACDVTKTFVDPRQPWVKDDSDTVLYKMFNIYQDFYRKPPDFT